MSEDKESSILHPFKPGMRKLFGDLEAEIMEVAWARPDDWLTVREGLEALNEKGHHYAYTTIMTVMSNLAKKGALVTEKDGPAYRYRPSLSKEEYTRTMVGKILDQLLEDFSEPVLSHFAQALQERSLSEDLAARIEKARESEG
ncbi:MAG: BlaI/MecI/CopY family transcriptional regulator [Bacteroidota bacterium]